MSTQSFHAEVRQVGEIAIIDLHGEINAFANQDLNSVFGRAESLSSTLIALNFQQVSYINSTGIALIVGLLARARNAQRRLFVFDLSPHYQEIFKVTRLTDYIDIYPDEASLLASIPA